MVENSDVHDHWQIQRPKLIVAQVWDRLGVQAKWNPSVDGDLEAPLTFAISHSDLSADLLIPTNALTMSLQIVSCSFDFSVPMKLDQNSDRKSNSRSKRKPDPKPDPKLDSTHPRVATRTSSRRSKAPRWHDDYVRHDACSRLD